MLHRSVYSLHCNRVVVSSLIIRLRIGFVPAVSVSNGKKGRIVQANKKLIQKLGNQKIKIKSKLQSVKSFSKENIFTLPNLLSMGRLVTTPFLGYLILHSLHSYAAATFALLSATDLVDGYIARNFKGQSSVLGSIIDPLADKLMIGTAMVTLSIVQILPVPLVSLFLFRDGGLILFSFYLRYISLSAPVSLRQYFDLRLKTVQATPSTISKVNTVLQALLISASLLAPVFNLSDHPALPALWYITATTTVWSAVDYLWFKSGYRIIRKKRRLG